MITAVIADDEAYARERLRDLLDRFALFDIRAEARDGDEALSAIITHRPQVAFLDITMPGVSVFASLSSLHTPPLIVFQTAYAEHAPAAFDLDALDYLLKPVRLERLEQTVARIKERLATRVGRPPTEETPSLSRPPERITVRIGKLTKVVALTEIVRISFADGCCHIYTRHDELLSDRYLSHYEGLLPADRFLRVGRTEIINLDHVAQVHTLQPGLPAVELDNGMTVNVSRRRAQRLRSILGF